MLFRSILTMSGLYTINLFFMGSSSNLSLIGKDTIFSLALQRMEFLGKENVRLLVAIIFAILIIGFLAFFYKTHLGLCIRATGDNEAMVKASSINVDAMKILALAMSNAIVALSGAMIANYQGFADINSGVGILVVGLASVIIGEVIFGKRSVLIGFISAMVGSVVYRFIIAFAMKSNIFPAYALKLVSACIVAFALSLPAIKGYIRFYQKKAKANK